MAVKNVYLFDDTNLPLKVTGIQIELLDSITGLLIDKQLSVNRNPALGAGSTEWGADLTFTSAANPLDIYITDKTYQYPGNTIQFLNGQTNDRIDIDLMKIPTSPLGNPPSANSSPATIVSAIQSEKGWTVNEKRAAINLVSNYTDIIYKGTISSPELPGALQRIVTNWDDALRKVGIDGIKLDIQAFAVTEF